MSGQPAFAEQRRRGQINAWHGFSPSISRAE
jgi:hypothetical protein